VAENGSITPIELPMGHAGASRKSPNDAPWETLSLRLRRPISAPLLTVARSWSHEKNNCYGEAAGLDICVFTSCGLAWSTMSESVSMLHLIVRLVFVRYSETWITRTAGDHLKNLKLQKV